MKGKATGKAPPLRGEEKRWSSRDLLRFQRGKGKSAGQVQRGKDEGESARDLTMGRGKGDSAISGPHGEVVTIFEEEEKIPLPPPRQ